VAGHFRVHAAFNTPLSHGPRQHGLKQRHFEPVWSVIRAARRAVRSRLNQTGCAWLTEESTRGRRALWRAAARQLSVRACARSMVEVPGAAWRTVGSVLKLAGCAILTQQGKATTSTSSSSAAATQPRRRGGLVDAGVKGATLRHFLTFSYERRSLH
jgi:hypothetical protein